MKPVSTVRKPARIVPFSRAASLGGNFGKSAPYVTILCTLAY